MSVITINWVAGLKLFIGYCMQARTTFQIRHAYIRFVHYCSLRQRDKIHVQRRLLVGKVGPWAFPFFPLEIRRPWKGAKLISAPAMSWGTYRYILTSPMRSTEGQECVSRVYHSLIECISDMFSKVPLDMNRIVTVCIYWSCRDAKYAVRADRSFVDTF